MSGRNSGRTYRVVKAHSGEAALEVARQLQQRNEIVALFLTDQRMPQMTGIQFLEQAREIFPEAKKVLLTAYADTEVAIASINDLQLDYYLMKPWDPPEENLYPVLEDLLEDWQASVRMPFEGLRVAGTLWSPRSHEVKDFLARHQIAYQWLDVEKDAKARAMVEGAADRRTQTARGLLPGRSSADRSGDSRAGGEDGLQDQGLPAVLRSGHHRRRPGRSGGGRVRCLQRDPLPDHREAGARRAGRQQSEDRKLPRIPQRPFRHGPGASRHRAGKALWRRDHHDAVGEGDPGGGRLPRHRPCPTAPRSPARPC